MGKTPEQTHLTKDIQMAHKRVKRSCISFVIREMKNKMTKYHYTPIRITKIWNTENTKC